MPQRAIKHFWRSILIFIHLLSMNSYVNSTGKNRAKIQTELRPYLLIYYIFLLKYVAPIFNISKRSTIKIRFCFFPSKWFLSQFFKDHDEQLLSQKLQALNLLSATNDFSSGKHGHRVGEVGPANFETKINMVPLSAWLWSYGLSSFQGRDIKLERCLAKNQYPQRKLLHFVN